MLDTTQDIFFALVLILTGLTALSWLTFGQFSMRPIEKKMKTDGLPNQFAWDGLGGRITFYALAIVLPERFALRLNRLMDVSAIRSYANNRDWWRGMIFITVTNTWIISIFGGTIFGLFD